MARIEHIKHRLERWGAWIERSESGGTGYPKQSSFLRLPGPMGLVQGPITALDLECGDTHDAVISMRHSKPYHFKCVELIYRQNRAYKVAANIMGKNESTIRLYLEQADNAIDQWLRDKSEAAKQIKQLTP